MNYAYGDIYEGEFKNGKKYGFGKITSLNGDVKEGRWEDDEFIESWDKTISNK